jgi:hypothetical protein
MKAQGQKALLRLGILWASIPIAFLIGYATHSSTAFVVVMAIGLVVHLVLRLSLLRWGRFANDPSALRRLYRFTHLRECSPMHLELSRGPMYRTAEDFGD